MMWREVYGKLTGKMNKDICWTIAVNCCVESYPYSKDETVLNTIIRIRSGECGREKLMEILNKICRIRSNEKEDLKAREAAHVVLHAIEVICSSNYVNASGHAARCLEALSKIDSTKSGEIVNRFLM